MLNNPYITGIDLADFIGGITVVPSPWATREKWNFKPSRHRSKRVHKKLLKRFGCQTVKVPAMYMIDGTYVAHPEMIEALKPKRLLTMVDADKQLSLSPNLARRSNT